MTTRIRVPDLGTFCHAMYGSTTSLASFTVRCATWFIMFSNARACFSVLWIFSLWYCILPLGLRVPLAHSIIQWSGAEETRLPCLFIRLCG